MPDIVIRTTFITGLPGETEEAFDALCAFIEEARFERLGVFAYSPEEGTVAASMPDQVEREIAESRRDEIMRIQQQISLEKNQELVGSVQDVIVDGLDEEKGDVLSVEADGAAEAGDAAERIYIGRTKGDAPEIDNAIIFSGPNEVASDAIIGKIVKVHVTDAMDYDLVGELL